MGLAGGGTTCSNTVSTQLTEQHNLHDKKQEAHGPHRSPEKTVQIIKQI